MDFCASDEVARFLETAPGVEKATIDSGIILIKYWLEVSAEEQTRRLKSRIDDPRKIWKLSGMDLKSYGRWYDYSRARDEMFTATDTHWAPWFVAHTDDKKRGRLNIISHLLSQVPYEPLRKNKSHPAEAAETWSLPGPGPAAENDPNTVLNTASATQRKLECRRCQSISRPLLHSRARSMRSRVMARSWMATPTEL